MTDAITDAITDSILRTEIVTLDWTEEAEDELLAASDDSVHGVDGEDQYWGITESGQEWRVHLRRAE